MFHLIFRKEKFIVVNNKEVIKYDFLILTCGLQYASPAPKIRASAKNRCKKNYRGFVEIL